MSDGAVEDAFDLINFESTVSDVGSFKSSGSDKSLTRRNVSSQKRNLSTTRSPRTDSSPSTSKKHKLNYLPLPDDDVQKSSNDCEQMLRQIIRTAYQFTRHGRREKLTLNDLEKAFTTHNVDMKPDDAHSLIDKNDVDSAKSGNESQIFACTGMWLVKETLKLT